MTLNSAFLYEPLSHLLSVALFSAYKKVHKVSIKASPVPWVGHLNEKSESDLQLAHMCKLPKPGMPAKLSREAEESVSEPEGSNKHQMMW